MKIFAKKRLLVLKILCKSIKKFPKSISDLGNFYFKYLRLYLHSDKTLCFLSHLVSDYEDEYSRNPHRREERKENSKSEHKSESFNHTDTEDIENNSTGERSDMTIPDS